MFPATARLEAVYRATAYGVTIGGRKAVLRIGVPPPKLPWGACRQAWFVTACNPRSRPRPAAANRRAARRLVLVLRQCGLRVLPGLGRGDAGDWPPEPSLLVFGLPRRSGPALGRALRQNAVLCVDRHAVMLIPLA